MLAVSLIFGLLSTQAESAEYLRWVLADGFDYPVGKPDSWGYYKARGYRANGHQGEDWNGRGGGNTDLGDAVYSIGHGVVVYSADYASGWGNVVILRHAYRHTDDGSVYYIDSLYGHLHERMVKLNDKVRRGQKIGTIGTNRGMYYAHLHFEIRKNLSIGMSRSKYAQDFSNYFDPSAFIKGHRSLRKEYRFQRIPVGTFGSGISNRFRGTSIGDIPPLPEPNPDARETLDADLREILRRNQVDRESQGKQPLPKTADGPVRPKEDTPEAQAEREQIRELWRAYRAQLREAEGEAGKTPVPE
ncbi:MAG: murein DD-endopeptidase MepM/ murein hydrolase activator NlpD [Verrucomicrobiales bacterium]